MEPSLQALVALSAQEGESLSVVGDTYRILITGEQTGGAFAVIDMLVPPGGGPGPHAHPDFQESFYVLAGEVEVKTEERTYVAQQGGFVSIPKGGMIHQFKNQSDATAHLLCLVVPAGLETLFQEIGQPVPFGNFQPPDLSPENRQRLKDAAEKHGQKLYPPDYLDTKK